MQSIEWLELQNSLIVSKHTKLPYPESAPWSTKVKYGQTGSSSARGYSFSPNLPPKMLSLQMTGIET